MEQTIAQIIAQRTSQLSETPPPKQERPISQKLANFFESFQINGAGWNDQERAFAACCLGEALRFASDMLHKEPGRMMSIVGQTSSGKTMLAKLLRKFWNRCAPPRNNGFHHASFITWPNHDWHDLDNERDAPMIVLDEVGRGERGKNGTDWGRLIDFINFRQERRLWTVITSNLSFHEIEDEDPAIASRLRRYDGVVLQAGTGVRPFEKRRDA